MMNCNRNTKRCFTAGLVTGLAALLMGNVACAGTVIFSDSIYDLSSYTETTYSSSSAATITSGQTLTGGNPGSAYQLVAGLPSGSQAGAILINNSFLYEVAMYGAAQSIDWSLDTYVTDSPLTVSAARGAYLVIEQNGNYYYNYNSGGLQVTGLWETAGAGGILASAFNEFSLDTATGSLSQDAGQHPDFAQSFLLGTMLGQGAVGGSITFDSRLDNYSVTVHTSSPVPLPATGWLLGSGLIGFGMLRRTRRASTVAK